MAVRRSLVIALSVLIALLAYFALKPTSAPTRDKTKSIEASKTAPETPKPKSLSVSNPAIEDLSAKPLIRWSEIPPSLAMKVMPLGRFLPDRRLLASLDWNDMLSRLSTSERMGIPKEESDRRRRAIGFLVAVDGVLMSELPVELEQGMYSYPDEYFPRATVIPKSISDPAAVEEKLLSMLSSGMEGLAEKLPRQFRQPEALLALQNRALLLLGSFSDSPRALEALRKAYTEGPPGLRAASAAALAFAGHDDAAQELMSSGAEPAIQSRLLGALSNSFGKYWCRVEGDQVFRAWSSVCPTARSLDGSILDLSLRGSDQEVRRTATVALVARQDNPHARAAVLDRLHKAEDPLLAYDMIAEGLLIDSASEAKSILLRNLDSPHVYLRTQALFFSAMVQDPVVIDRLIPHLDAESYDIRSFALAAMAQAGRMNPEKAIAAMRGAALRRPQDANFKNDVRMRIDELLESADPKAILEWLAQHPDHRLP